MLTTTQEKFLAQRRFLLKSSPWIGRGMFLALVIFVVYMYFTHPVLANPYYVMGLLENNSLSTSTLSMLAMIGSLLFLTISFFLGFFIVFFLLAVRNERKLIEIIDAFQKRET